MSAPTLREDLSLTVRLVESRARRYRYLVLVVLVVVFASLGWAATQISLSPILGLLSIPCLCGLFFWLDAISVNHWRIQVLTAWLSCRLDIDDFHYALANMKHLPTKTIASLLGSLPTKAVVGAPVADSPSLRQAIAQTLTCIHSCLAARSISVTGAWIIGSISIASAVVARSWLPCLALALILAVLGLASLWRLVQFQLWRREVQSCCATDEEMSRFVEVATRLDWEGISNNRKNALLASLRTSPPSNRLVMPVQAPE